MSPQPYQFTPLRNDEIRLLQLESSDYLEDPLICSMHTLELGTDTQALRGRKLAYATLSYTWGKQSSLGLHLTHSLKCDGHTLRITSTLDRALRRIRAIDLHWWTGFHDLDNEPDTWRRPPLLWVDQACINQQDIGERNHQVSRMADIYKRSACLIIWLGEIDEEDGTRVKEAIAMDAPGQEPKSLLELQWRNSLDSLGGNWAYEMDHASRNSLLESFLSRPWFSRRWVVQEVVNTLDATQFMLVGKEILRPFDIRRSSGLLSIDDGRGDACYRPEKHNLLFLLQEFDKAECTEPHDLVYALLPIAKDASKFCLEIDYSKTFEDVCKDIVRGALQPSDRREGCVFRLVVLAASRHTVPTSKLPSWIPDWRASVSYTCDEHRHITRSLAYHDYHIHSDYMQVDDCYVFLKGLLVQPCFPPLHETAPNDSTDSCQCCTFWSAQYYQFTDGLRAVLRDAASNRYLLFIPLFQQNEEFRTILRDEQITFVLSRALDLERQSCRIVYHLKSCFGSKRMSASPLREQSAWVCLG